MTDDLIERLRQLAGNTGKMTWVGDLPMPATAVLHLSADRIEELEAWKAAEEAHHHLLRQELDRCRASNAVMDNTVASLTAEVERLRRALDAVWKEATTMRNASKLVGPYPTNPADNRIWARSMYHAGKRIMEMLKPARAALEGTSHE